MAVSTLNRQELFKFLRPDQVNVLSKYSDLLEFKPGAMVYHRGAKADFFYIVISGKVALRLPGKSKNSDILIEEVGEGGMFGGSIAFALDSYFLNAQCIDKTEILRINSSVLREIMEEDKNIGFTVQAEISKNYYMRYIDTMKKLQALVMNVPEE